jgi:hypothetical protein
MIMDALFTYGVAELNSEILNFYQLLLPLFSEQTESSLFDKVITSFHQVPTDPVMIQTLFSSLQLLLNETTE